MKKQEEFDLEIAMERIQKKFLYEDVIKRLEHRNINGVIKSYDEEFEDEIDFDTKLDPADDPAHQLIDEIIEWYERIYSKLSKSDKDELKIEICYNYEIDLE